MTSRTDDEVNASSALEQSLERVRALLDAVAARPARARAASRA